MFGDEVFSGRILKDSPDHDNFSANAPQNPPQK